jgi:hypothetical protein
MDPILHHLESSAEHAIKPQFTQRVLARVDREMPAENPWRVCAACSAALALATTVFWWTTEPRHGATLAPDSGWIALLDDCHRWKSHL